MTSITIISGTWPIRAKKFNSRKILLSMTQAFSGGLFLSIGILHLLPESYDKYQESDIKNKFPLPFLVMILSFSLILFIEKIATNHQHQHDQHDEGQLVKIEGACCDAAQACCNQVENRVQEDNLKKAVSTTVKVAQRVSFVTNPNKNCQLGEIKEKQINLAPYLLQIAVGIHAIFEGIAIGIETNLSKFGGIFLSVLCHKWAEGLTLGIAFRQAKIRRKTATIMILIQAIMNPIGIIIGWIISSQNDYLISIFYAISAGTFLYISTIEVIVEEFNISRYKCCKYICYMSAIGFVSLVWYIEQLEF
ncbi:hypothetical protein pb186bvf_019645 [Paramecium bursaria]